MRTMVDCSFQCTKLQNMGMNTSGHQIEQAIECPIHRYTERANHRRLFVFDAVICRNPSNLDKGRKWTPNYLLLKAGVVPFFIIENDETDH